MSGGSLGTGATLTETGATTTTTYYVQEQTSNESYTIGETAANAALFWANIAGQTGQWIDVQTDITIKSVNIYTMGAATGVKLLAIDEFGNIVAGGTDPGITVENHPDNPTANWEEKQCNVNSIPTTLTPNISLSPGQYMLVVVGVATTAVDECNVDFGVAMQSTGELTETTATYDGNVVDGAEEAGVYFLEGACHIAWGHTTADGGYGTWDIGGARDEFDADHIHYGTLFSIQIETGASSSCPRASATIIVNDCTPLSINIDSPNDGATVDMADLVTIDVTTGGTVESVTYTVTGPDSYSNTFGASASNGYDVDFTFPTAGVFTITVNASNTKPETAQDAITVNVTAIGFAELFENAGIELFPNPSTNDFNIKADELAGYTINVYTSNGSLAESSSTTGSDLTFGSDLEAGVYTVELITPEHVYSSKVIKN